MSLTSTLTDTSNQALRDRLKSDFLNPGLPKSAIIKAPSLTANYGIVGSAFDYLMRFYVEQLNFGKQIYKSRWVSDTAFKSVINVLKAAKTKKVKTGFLSQKKYAADELLEIITVQYLQAKNAYGTFLEYGVLNDQLLTSCLFLAKLDLHHRADIIDHTLDDHNIQDVTDLATLIKLVNEADFLAGERIYLNPTFGRGSMLVGGADADLIVDRTLIDIKCTRHFKLARRDLNQILCYYILSLIDRGRSRTKDKHIEAVGIYFARFGVLWKAPISSFGDSKKIHSFKEWFVEYLKE